MTTRLVPAAAPMRPVPAPQDWRKTPIEDADHPTRLASPEMPNVQRSASSSLDMRPAIGTPNFGPGFAVVNDFTSDLSTIQPGGDEWSPEAREAAAKARKANASRGGAHAMTHKEGQ